LTRTHTLINALRLISASEPEKIEEGLSWFTDNIPILEGDKYRQALQAIASVFTHDVYEKPQYQGVINKAVEILTSQGELGIPYLLEMLADSDFKVNFNLAVVLGKIGVAAINPLQAAYQTSRHPAEKAFIIYALGKITDQAIVEIIPLMLAALNDPDREVRDSAARALGRISQSVEAARVPEKLRTQIFNRLLEMTRDEYSGVRSKAIRSLGKLAANKFLTEEQCKELQKGLLEILGKSGDFIWDSAFIVRREAEAVYEQLTCERSENRDEG